MDLDPERLRLKRMEEAMEAERRSLQEDKRRLEQERAQMDSHRHAAAPQGPPAPPPAQATWSPAAAEQPQPSGSKGGLFLGLAGGVLLVGVLLVAGKAWLQAKADENVGIEADTSGTPGQAPSPVLAAVVPPEAVDADATGAEDAQTDTVATPELDAVAAAAAPTPEAADADASESDATEPDTTEPDTADADATGPGAATQLKAEGAAPDLKAEAAKPEAAKTLKKTSRPLPTPVKPKPEPAKKADAGGLQIDQSALGAQMRKEQEKKKQLELINKEFKKSQGK